MKNTLFICLVLFLLSACSGDGNNNGDVNGEIIPNENTGPVIQDSTREAAVSHNTGSNCTQGSCHDGVKAAYFQTAGSVFLPDDPDTPYVGGATVYIYADEARTDLLQTIEVDKLGNFYSGEPLDYDAYVDANDAKYTGVFITLATDDASIDKIHRAPDGECNACHDHGQEPRIYAP